MIFHGYVSLPEGCFLGVFLLLRWVIHNSRHTKQPEHDWGDASCFTASSSQDFFYMEDREDQTEKL